jgi:ABC-type sugar transport system ATPase subunit
MIPFKRYQEEVRRGHLLSIKTDGIETELQNLSGGNQQR